MNLLERKRLDLGLSTYGLERAIREQTGEVVSERLIRAFENGHREPQAAKLKLIADTLGVAPSELLADVRAHRNGEAA